MNSTSAIDSADQEPPGPPDLLLLGGELVDGTGGRRRRADVAIRGDRIVAIGDLSDRSVGERRDVTGMVVAPGFIDAHGHSDIAVLSTPQRAE